jgi:hypothetical protein
MMSTELDFNQPHGRRTLLAQALQLSQNEEACQRCLSRLDDYITAQLSGEDYLAGWPEVAAHLDGCLRCAEAYARLYALEQAILTETLPEPVQLPVPDLSFLLPEAPGPLSPAALRAQLRLKALAEQIQAALQHLKGRIRLQLTPALLPLLQPIQAPARAIPSAELLLRLDPEEIPGVHLALSLAAYREEQLPEACRVEILVQPPGRSWPDLAGIQVTLTAAGQQQQASTNAWGEVSFSGVPVAALPHLAVEFGI